MSDETPLLKNKSSEIKISTLNKIIIVLCVLVIIGAIIIYFVFKKKIDNKVEELMSSKEEFIQNDNTFENDNTLKYYGAHYCPHSNEKSIAYRTIREFKEKR